MSDATSKRIGSDPQRVDLVVKKGTVSGVHALFGRDADGTLWLEDLGARTGPSSTENGSANASPWRWARRSLWAGPRCSS